MRGYLGVYVSRCRQVASLTALALALGCNGVSWPSERLVTSLRVLAVRADPASVAPGQSSSLSLLCADGSGGGTVDPSCTVEVAWFGDCNNPLQNDPTKCFDRYAAWFPDVSSPLTSTPASPTSAQFADAPEFNVVPPPDVLQGQVTVAGQTVHYGTSYVFFAACAGKLYSSPGVTDRLPVACRDSDSGALLGQSRFVVGVTTLYSYDAITNQNPDLLNPSFDGIPIPTQSCSVTSDCGPGFDCTSDATCAPVVATCARSNPAGCLGHCLSVQVSPSSFALTTLDATPILNPLKSLWTDFYTNAGTLPDASRLALQAPKNEVDPANSPCAAWRAPNYATEQARIWLIVRDDHGGISWLAQRILVR